MIYAYIRVSTDKQTTENQKYEIANFCKANNIIVDKWIEETISSTKELKKRKLGNLIKLLKKDDLVIASELSRLGRKLLEVMSILNHCLNKGAKIWTIKDNFQLNSDIQSKVLAFAFGLAAEIERNLISQRTKEALASRKAQGIILGRPKGRKNVTVKLSKYKYQIQELLIQGLSQRKIAKKFKVHRTTVANFLKRE